MWPGGGGSGNGNGTRASSTTSTVTANAAAANGANNSSTTGAGGGTTGGGGASAAAPQPSFSGLRVNDKRTANQQQQQQQRWIDHQQAQQQQQWNTPSGQWGPHGAGAPGGAPQPWPLATAAQPWPGAPSSNTGTGASTYAEHAKKSMVGRGSSSGQAPVQGRYDQQQQWSQVKVDQQTPWDTGGLSGFGSIHGANDAKSVAGEWGGAAGAPNARWGLPATQWPLHAAAATSNATAADFAAAVAAAAQVSRHRHDATTGAAPWPSAAAAATTPLPAGAALLPQPVAAWGQTAAAAQQTPTAALPNPTEQYDPNPQTPGPWVAPQPQEMNNDMMWRDPNPKQKKVQRDTGTAIWGDPSQQPVEIKRWKDADMDDYSHVQSATQSGGDWSTIPITTNGSTPCLGTNGTPGGSAGGTGHATNSCCSATGTGVSTPTTTGNGPWPDGSPHPEASSSGHQERWQQHTAWGDKLDTAVDNHHPPDLLSGPPMGGIGMHVLMDSAMIRPDITGSSLAGATSYTSLTQQIADRIRIAVNKGVIEMSLLNRPLPQGALIYLNALLQKFPKLEQAKQEYQQVMRAASSPAQKVESERLAVEINGLEHEIMQLRNSIHDELIKARQNTFLNGTLAPLQQQQQQQQQQQDGQSRLQQWKQANAVSTQDDKLCASSSDPNVSGLIAGAQGMSLDEKIDWKAGSLDWSPPPSGTGDKGPDTSDKDDPSSGSGENKQHHGTSSTTNQSGTGTPTPQQSQAQAQAVAPVDDGPQEFVPGKKWEWRDPNKVAEDPNATPGTCKPNPLLTTSSAGQPFQLYSTNTSSSSPQGGTLTGTALNTVTTAASYLNDLQTINRTSSAGYLGWNGSGGGGSSGAFGASPAATTFGTNDIWPLGAGGAAARQSRLPSGPASVGPFGHAAVRAGLGATAGPVVGPFQRSISSPFNMQQPQQQQWIFIQFHGVNEKQVQMLCQKVGQIIQAVCPHGAPFLCVKFMEPVDEIIRRLKVEAPFLQVKALPEAEVDRLLKPRAALPYGGPMGPGAAAAEPWTFGASGVGALLPGGAVTATDLLPQQPHFHAGDTATDLTRPF